MNKYLKKCSAVVLVMAALWLCGCMSNIDNPEWDDIEMNIYGEGVTDGKAELMVGDTLRLLTNATLSWEKVNAVNWASTDEHVARVVSYDGLVAVVVAFNGGVCDITATSAGNSLVTDVVKLTVNGVIMVAPTVPVDQAEAE